VSDPRTRFTRALLLATAAVALVALVAVAAGGYRLGGSNSTHASPYAVDVILTVVIALYLVAAIGVVVVMFWSGLELRRIPRQQTKRERTVRTVAILVGMAVLITVAANRYHWRAHPHPPTQPAQAGSGKGGKHTKGSHAKAKQQPQLRVAPFLAVLGAAGVAFAAFVIAERRRRRRLPKDWGVAEVLSDVLDETLDDLRAEPDPRRAVIAAYARMERSLAAHGIPRRRFEAPHEYLTRVLSEVSGGRLAATRLTALFERARFSPHEVDENMKASAIEAIESLQADLAAAELEEAAA
jgi:beta-lactamase regulating signal transducer with metallopeptidase domain